MNDVKSCFVSGSFVASALGVSRTTVWNWEKSGKIKSFRLPSGYRRYPLSEITRIMDGPKTAVSVEPISTIDQQNQCDSGE